MTTFATKYPRVFEEATPFLITAGHNLAGMELAPFGVEIGHIVDPLRMESRLFVERIHVIDRLAFAPRALHMPQWIFFDGSAVTGAMFGFAIPAARLDADAKDALELEAPAPELVPLSIYAAIPTHQAGVWMGHNLASLGGRVPNLGLRGLGVLTKAIALSVFGVARQCGVTQWSAGALSIHTRFGPLELLSAYTPAHTRPDTLTYVWDVTPEKLRAAMGDPAATVARPTTNGFIEGGDREAMIRLQREIEGGRRVIIPAPPEITGASVRVPIHYLD